MADTSVYKTIFEMTNVGMAIADLSGGFIQVNKSLCDLLGYTKEELQNRTFQEISHASDLKEDLHHIEEINKGLIDTFSMEKRYFKKNGELVWVDLTVTAVRKADKKVDYYIAVIKDIDELKQAQFALRLEEEKAKLYLDVAAVMLLALDRNGKIRLINPKGCEILGYSQEELLGKDWIETVLPKRVQADVKELMQSIFSGNIEPVEYFENSVITKVGEERTIAWHNGAIRDHNGDIIGLMTSGQDITDEKQAQEELRLQKEEFETIFKASKDGIAILDLESHFLDFNDAYLKFTGFSREEMLTKSCIEMSIPEDVPRARQAVQEAIEKGYVENFEKSCIVKNGKQIAINMSLALLPDKTRLLITTKDMSAKKAYEDLLKKTIEQQEALLKIETAGFVHIKDRKFTWTNRAFEKMLGYEAGELVGKDTRILYSNDEEYESFGRESSIAFETSKTYNKEINCLRKDGKALVLMKSLTAIEGSPGEALGVFVDITQMKENEREIQKAETKFFTLFNEALNPIAVVDPIKHKILEVNPAATELYGYTNEEFKQLDISAIEMLEDQAEINKRQEAMITKGWDRFTTKHRTKEGSILDVDVSVRAIQLENKPYLYATFHDITAQKNNERQLIEVKTELEKQKIFITSLLDAQPNMMLLTDGEISSFMNKAALKYFNCRDLDEFKERYNCICYRFIKNDAYFHLGKVQEGQNWIEVLLRLPQDQHIVTIQSLKDGIVRAFNISVRKFNSDYAVNFTDISETVVKQRDLEDKTTHDKLTKAYNREYLEQNIQRILSQNETVAFAMVDIDHFKKINDTYGHDVGDKVLKDLVKVLDDFSRKEDILIRWGGEEFLLLLKVDEKTALAKVLEHIRKAIEEHKFPVANKITCSFGAVLHDPSHAWEMTFKSADIALYEAKASGRNRVVVSV
ncbi:PAS domain S-box protein [Sulfurimonas sp. HSL-1716]|uniref:PAS domain S-box protein n=1 Tax=Hydrocurvibacter sulfurireducens TaxID=3131937 RepID=UPI0031F90552